MANDGPRWFEQSKGFDSKLRVEASEAVDLFVKCPSCGEALYKEALADNAQVCPTCAHHFRLEAMLRIRSLCDEGSVKTHDEGLAPVDRLRFFDSKSYSDRIRQSRAKTGRNDAFVAVSATLDGVPVELGVFDFRYMGGSMGSVVGEQVTRLFERALEHECPAIVVSASGGARMQEGVLSLMQMAKTCAALQSLRDAGLPYISVLTHPTTGGVAASFAMLGDLILAEPQALIGFAGPRVIKETIGQDLPKGFQTSEYLLENGMVDAIVPRKRLKHTLARTLRMLLHLPATEASDVEHNFGSREALAGGPAYGKPD